MARLIDHEDGIVPLAATAGIRFLMHDLEMPPVIQHLKAGFRWQRKHTGHSIGVLT